MRSRTRSWRSLMTCCWSASFSLINICSMSLWVSACCSNSACRPHTPSLKVTCSPSRSFVINKVHSRPHRVTYGQLQVTCRYSRPFRVIQCHSRSLEIIHGHSRLLSPSSHPWPFNVIQGHLLLLFVSMCHSTAGTTGRGTDAIGG